MPYGTRWRTTSAWMNPAYAPPRGGGGGEAAPGPQALAAVILPSPSCASPAGRAPQKARSRDAPGRAANVRERLPARAQRSRDVTQAHRSLTFAALPDVLYARILSIGRCFEESPTSASRTHLLRVRFRHWGQP